MVPESSTRLRDRSIGDYLDTLASDAPTPGGGSVAGVIGALAAALGQMVANVTRKTGADETLATAAATLRERGNAFVAGSEADEAAYAGYIAATRLPRGSADEKRARQIAIQEALIAAANAPLVIANAACDLLDDLLPAIQRGGAHILSDAEIAILLAEAAVASGLINVRVNIPYLKDPIFAGELETAANLLETTTTERARACHTALAARREKP